MAAADPAAAALLERNPAVPKALTEAASALAAAVDSGGIFSVTVEARDLPGLANGEHTHEHTGGCAKGGGHGCKSRAGAHAAGSPDAGAAAPHGVEESVGRALRNGAAGQTF